MTKKLFKDILSYYNLELIRTIDVDKIKSVIAPWKPKAILNCNLVRIGAGSDGGYLLPSDFGRCKSLLSPGVGDNNSFERAFQKTVPNSQVYQLDGTIDKAPPGLSNSHFEKLNLGSIDTESTITLTSWIQNICANHRAKDPFILQMDIEGAEYSSITVTPSTTLEKFGIIIIELHSLDRLTNFDFCERFKLLTEKLLLTHTVVHLHPNNRRRVKNFSGIEIHPTLEVTLVKTSDYRFGTQKLSFPHHEDYPCDPELPDVALSADWI